ncbi:hypothetical protein BASA81_008678 [Batrachochytrium salamandrivorans]|nr:hypothetical protein BASA81_008678 [Batrachochytrium salamandrivorans]
MSLYEKGERATHVSQENVRTNCVVIKVHSDQDMECYYTVVLDHSGGREVQTVGGRLKKGEYTGVGAWQRVLDDRTACYFFFNDLTQETLWDTPEAREQVYGDYGDGGDNDHYYGDGGDYEERPISPIAQFQPPSQPKPQPPPLQPQQQQQQSVNNNPRAVNLAQSPEFRQALMSTGTESLQRNLNTLGIQIPTQSEAALAQVLAGAISKVSATLEEEDLFLLVHHCLGGKTELAPLAKQLANPQHIVVALPPPQRVPPSPQPSFVQYDNNDEEEEQQHSFVEEPRGFAPSLPQQPNSSNVSFDRPPSRAPPSIGSTKLSKDYSDGSKRKFEQDEFERYREAEWRRFEDERRRWQIEEDDRRRYEEDRRRYEERRYYEDLERARYEEANARRFRDDSRYTRSTNSSHLDDRLYYGDRKREGEDYRSGDHYEQEQRSRLESDNRLFDDDPPFPNQQQQQQQQQQLPLQGEEKEGGQRIEPLPVPATTEPQTNGASPVSEAIPTTTTTDPAPADTNNSFNDIATVQSDMDKLLQSLSKADNIDQGWRVQHEATQKELEASEAQIRSLANAQKPTPPTKPSQPSAVTARADDPLPRAQRMAPPPSKACGVCSVM